MKKNVMMRIASVLLVAVLLTTCAISGTFAKYVTTGSGFDTARVAKWGVTINGSGVEAFATDYDTTVTSTAKVVAPGTDGEFGKITIGGTPEVDTKVTFDAAVDLTGWMVDGVFYCPVKIYVNSVAVDTSACVDAAQYSAAVSNAVKAVYEEFEANNPIDTDALTVEWYWPFSTSAENDKKDTALGDQSAVDENANKIKVTITATVTQVD